MHPRTTSHLVLLLIAVLWAVLVVHSLEYVGRFMFHTFLISVRWLQILFIALTLYMGTMMLLSVRRRPVSPPAGAARPVVSVLIPPKDEERVIDGGSTDGTPRILRRRTRELGVRVVRTPIGGRGKAAALNIGTRHARGDLLAVFDADARVAPDYLQRLIAALDDPRIGGVGGRLLFYNAGQNLLPGMQDDEFAIMQPRLQRVRQATGAFVTFAGNGLLVRREALRAAGGWNEDALTEDIDLSLRLYLAGWRIRYCDDAVVWEGAVGGVRALVRQRTRWFEGALRCLGEQLPALLVGRVPLRVRLDMLFFLAGLLLATLALLTTYTYALIGLAGAVVLFLGIPQEVMAAISAFFTIALVAAVVDERGWSPLAVGGVLLRSAIFSLHRVLVVPLAILRYVHAAVTGRVDWAKTAHLGEMSAEAAGDARLS